jgi:apolipoprotein N-acyltransferase
MKMLYPAKTGLFIGNGSFLFGTFWQQPQQSEVLGNAFIPVVALLGLGFYFLVIFLLKLVRNNKS